LLWLANRWLFALSMLCPLNQKQHSTLPPLFFCPTKLKATLHPKSSPRISSSAKEQILPMVGGGEEKLKPMAMKVYDRFGFGVNRGPIDTFW